MGAVSKLDVAPLKVDGAQPMTGTAPSTAPPRKYDPGTPLAKLLRQCRHAFVLAFLLTLVTETLSIAPILFMLNIYDRVLASRSQVTLVSLTVLVVGVYVLWSAMEWVRSRLLVRISLRIDWDLAARTFDASFRRFVGRKKVNVHQVLGDLVQLRQFLTTSALLALMSSPFAIVFIAIGGAFHPYLAVFSLLASVILLVTSFLTQKVSTPLLRAANEASAESNRLAAESLRQAETALALGMQANIRNRWYHRHQDYLQMQVHASEGAGTLAGISGFLANSLPSLQLALAGYLAIEGLITGGMVIAASLLISKAIGPIQKLLANWKDISNARQSYERLDQLLLEDGALPDRMELPPPKGRLTVSNLFGVPPGGKRAVIQGVNFSVEPGQITTIIGQSAAGKTSLLKLLLGIWRPASGSVRLDGAEISDWAHDNLGQFIGYVPQEPDFFEGTVAENIARLGPVDPAKVVEAARLAGVHEIILAFPQGYETDLGPTGHVLTGGQRQRLAITRAFYANPAYIGMDEPNASLDEAGERALIEALKKLKARGTTIVLTTHRPSLMNIADNLLVLAQGNQGGFGPLKEMLAGARTSKGEPAAGEAPRMLAVAGGKNVAAVEFPRTLARTDKPKSNLADAAPSAAPKAKAGAAPRSTDLVFSLPDSTAKNVCQLRLQLLASQSPDRLENGADNIGPGWFDTSTNSLRLQFHFVSLFKTGAAEGFSLVEESSGRVIPLNPKHVGSPYIGEKHNSLAWAKSSRYVFDETLALAAPPQRLTLTVSITGKPQKLALLYSTSSCHMEATPLPDRLVAG